MKEFERQTGAKVKFVYMTGEDQMLQTLQQGGVGKIDVTLPNLQYVQPAVQRGLLQPVDQAKVTTWDELSPQFTKLPSIRSGGKLYAVPGPGRDLADRQPEGGQAGPGQLEDPLGPREQGQGRVLRRPDDRDHDRRAVPR